MPTLTVGVGNTWMLTVEFTAEQGLIIPVVVNVNTAVPLKPDGGAQVAFNAEALGLKVPPAGEVQTPPVAEPPIEPESGDVVPPWQMVCVLPALAVGEGKTITLMVDMAAGHGPVPVVVNVRMAVPL